MKPRLEAIHQDILLCLSPLEVAWHEGRLTIDGENLRTCLYAAAESVKDGLENYCTFL